jgi:hypothetical protein
MILYPITITAKKGYGYTICPADNETAGCLGRRRAGQLRFGFVAVLEGHIVYPISFVKKFVPKVIKYICKMPALSQFLNNEKPDLVALQVMSRQLFTR